MAKSEYTIDKWRVMAKREVRELPAATAPASAPAVAPAADAATPSATVAEPK